MDRNMSIETATDGASVYTAKTIASTRSWFSFRRKKSDGQEKSAGPRLVKKKSNKLKKTLPPNQTPKLVWSREENKFALDKDTGEARDHTEMLHALTHRESKESMSGPVYIEQDNANRKPGEASIASLPPQVWQRVADFISLSDTASLAFSTKTLLEKLGTGSWEKINLPQNQSQRIEFLIKMDGSVPNHLYCPLCYKYHLRTQNGAEWLKPTLVLNPLFLCPLAETTPPRTRIAPGRTLPFTFVQLALRGHKYGAQYGITLDSLSRRWIDKGWTHTTVYRVHNGHLLMRVISQKFAEGGMVEAAKRGFFYNMYEDFTPYFSVCAHWRHGELMAICKCAVDHIPPPKYAISEQHKMHKKALPQKPRIVALCGTCQPMRRCPECPTEYMVEIKLVEDQRDPVYHFKQAIVVTRWSDLGDGTTPDNLEWAACNGKADYNSVTEIGRRAVSGIFESKTSNDNMNIPGQRILSLNPKMEDGEKGDKWF